MKFRRKRLVRSRVLFGSQFGRLNILDSGFDKYKESIVDDGAAGAEKAAHSEQGNWERNSGLASDITTS